MSLLLSTKTTPEFSVNRTRSSRRHSAAALQDPPAPSPAASLSPASGGVSAAFQKRKQAVARLIRRITVFDDRVEIRLNVGLPTSPPKSLDSINTVK